MKHTLLALVLCGGIVVAADDDASKKMLKELEGTYAVAAAEKGGEKAPDAVLKTFDKLSVKGNKLTMSFKGDGKAESKTATITVDATKKPAYIDLKPEDGPNKDASILGIVEIDKDTVKFCWADGPNIKRPADFASSKENRNFLLTLKRSKE